MKRLFQLERPTTVDEMAGVLAATERAR